jgi:hypothetical protein
MRTIYRTVAHYCRTRGEGRLWFFLGAVVSSLIKNEKTGKKSSVTAEISPLAALYVKFT